MSIIWDVVIKQRSVLLGYVIVLISNVGMIEEYATWRAHDHVVLGKWIDEGRVVLISDVGMIE
jgi:hypothetical protein